MNKIALLVFSIIFLNACNKDELTISPFPNPCQQEMVELNIDSLFSIGSNTLLNNYDLCTCDTFSILLNNVPDSLAIYVFDYYTNQTITNDINGSPLEIIDDALISIFLVDTLFQDTLYGFPLFLDPVFDINFEDC